MSQSKDRGRVYKFQGIILGLSQTNLFLFVYAVSQEIWTSATNPQAVLRSPICVECKNTHSGFCCRRRSCAQCLQLNKEALILRVSFKWREVTFALFPTMKHSKDFFSATPFKKHFTRMSSNFSHVFYYPFASCVSFVFMREV